MLVDNFGGQFWWLGKVREVLGVSNDSNEPSRRPVIPKNSGCPQDFCKQFHNVRHIPNKEVRMTIKGKISAVPSKICLRVTVQGKQLLNTQKDV